MNRDDISDYLIHFTKGANEEEAFNRLRTILIEHQLIGSQKKIRGEHCCICFSEAPLAALENGLLNSAAYSRYSPFGVLFNKSHIYASGGRPVIYQAYEEYDTLPDTHNWRHVTYNPNKTPPVDYTWEREWRLLAEEFSFDGSVAAAVVPNHEWAERLVSEHEADERFRIQGYIQIMDEEIAIQYHQEFEWFVFTLRP